MSKWPKFDDTQLVSFPGFGVGVQLTLNQKDYDEARRAVNSHSALVEALEDALEVIDELEGCIPRGNLGGVKAENMRVVRKDARAALAKAKRWAVQVLR